MKYKKYISLLLTAAMAAGAVPAGAQSIENTGLSIAGAADEVETGSAVDTEKGGNTREASVSYEFGTEKTKLSAGNYDLPLTMMKGSDITSQSMAGSCIKSAVLTVNDDGSASIRVELGAVKIGTIESWAKDWKIYQSNDTSGDAVDAAAITDADGNVTAIVYNVPDVTTDGTYVNMFIDAMNTTQDAYFKYDYVNAVQGSESTEKVYEGTSHIDQFGEYDINVKVYVKDGIITSIEVEGANFGGTYAETNKVMLQKAVDHLKDMFTGKSSTDAEGIDGVEGATGATYASNGIKQAVLNALGLVIEDEIINVPTEKLAEGEYTVDIAYYSDVVTHSLVGEDKFTAKVKVDSEGKVTLTTDIVNGTEKEPLYVEAFNGYYTDNDITKELKTDAEVTMGTVDYSDDVFEKDTPVVTKLTFPLEGDYAKIYNTNLKLYVPAMKNLTGELNGVLFDKGVFNVNCFTKVYWDSLTKVEAPSTDYKFGSTGTELKPGSYTLPVALKNANVIADDSMAAGCIKGAVLTVNEDGTASVKVELQAVSFGGLTAYGSEWKYYKDGLNSELVSAEETKDADGKVTSIEFTLPNNNADGTYVNMYIDAMGYAPNAYMAMDFANASKIVEDGDYTADLKFLKIDSDDESSAGRSFVTTAVPVTVKDGSVSIKLAYSTSMITKIEQLVGDVYNELSVVNEGDSKYVVVTMDSINDIETLQFTIDTGTAMGTMVNQARLLIDTDTLKAVEETTSESTTESTSESTSESTTESTSESTSESTTESTSESTSESTTESTSESTSESTTESTTESTSESTTEATSESTTENTTATTTESDTETTTRRQTSSGGGANSGAGGSLKVSNAVSTTETTTEGTTSDTSEATTEETTGSISLDNESNVSVSIGKYSVTIGSNEYEMDAAPYIQSSSNSTLVPLRFVAIAISGGDIENVDTDSMIKWDAVTKTAVITKGDSVIEFAAGSDVMTVDGEAVIMENGVKSEIKDGRMYVPFRALGNALEVSVEWDAENKTASYLVK